MAATALDVGILVLTLVSPDISAPLDESGAAFVDLDIAPELDSFLTEDSMILADTMDAFMSWLYPVDAQAEIPLIVVTGTNGKTTTSRMIYEVLKQAGYAPGLACTEGIYSASGQLLDEGDLSGLSGHYALFTDPSLDSAVLETARGGSLTVGLAYSQCDVAVCLNVTDDHLEERGVNTLEQMAAVKRFIVQGAREAIILNADDGLCLSMLPFTTTRKTCLASTEQSSQSLWRQYGTDFCLAVVENILGQDHLVLYDQQQKILIAAVNELPATFNGCARHNIVNALHASAACYFTGAQPGAIRNALCQFRMNYENTPGRLNFYDELPFRALIDYAHNTDGVQYLCEFVRETWWSSSREA